MARDFSQVANGAGVTLKLVMGVLLVLLTSIVGSYFTTLTTTIPRSEAAQLIRESEDRSKDQIKNLSQKMDEVLQKMEDLRINVEILKIQTKTKEKE